jgi:YVTN family beta-propeller protein
VAVDPGTDRIYVATADDDAVAVIDGATNTIVTTISTVATP